MKTAVLLLAWMMAGTPPTPAPVLIVRVEGLRNTDGYVRLAVFRSSDGYPEQVWKATHTMSVGAGGRVVEARFEDVQPGVVALAVLHDENGNGRLDKNFLGVPLEGIGASRDATRRLGVPRFEDARLVIPRGGAILTVRLRYWF